MITAIINQMNLASCRPENILLLAIDGVDPRAKWRDRQNQFANDSLKCYNPSLNIMQRSYIILLLSYFIHSIAAASISQTEFNTAVKASGFQTPSTEVYNNVVQTTTDFSREELAMFIAQMLHESGGFYYTEELGCSNNRCRDRYKDKVGLPQKSYHGRGYIQLTWGENYKKASEGLGKGDLLLQQPELVASDKKLAVQTSVYYWKTRVRKLLNQGNNKNLFGITTKAINGNECKNRPRAEKRWKIYLKVADALKITNKAKENGCYN